MSSRPSPAPDVAATTHLLRLIARGEARSRGDVARLTGVAASTAGLRIQSLIDAGILEEAGDGSSRGGRRPRLLTISSDAGVIVSADLGGGHARIGKHTLDGRLVDTASIPIDLTDGPDVTLATVASQIERLLGAERLLAIGVGLPGPVDIVTSTVVQPSRMPGWPGYRVDRALAERFGVAVVVDNDASLAALGEHRARYGAGHHSITVKAGTAIGSGIIVDGSLHRGATGAAGDITHTRIDGSGDLPCSCGNTGCLETVASGASIVGRMREAGYDIATTTDVVRLALDAHPVATTAVRTAGTHLGQALAGVVNFFNPHAVFLTGSLSAAEPFLAAVRSRVYEVCHPLATKDLRIEAASTGADAILYGAMDLAFDQVALPSLTTQPA